MKREAAELRVELVDGNIEITQADTINADTRYCVIVPVDQVPQLIEWLREAECEAREPRASS